MLRPHLSRSEWTYLILAGLSFVAVFGFQNCGKAGFDDSSAAVVNIASTTADSRLTGAPFPFEANLNVISYMTCPMAGDSTAFHNPQDLMNPFYNVRAGAYDNLSYSSIFGASALSKADQSRRLQAGVGLTQEFLDYVQNTMKATDSATLRTSIMGATHATDLRLNLALINEDRSRADGGFGWDTGLFKPMLDILPDSVMANYLSTSSFNTNYGTKKQNFFSGLDSSKRGLVSSLSWGKSEVDRDNLNIQLRSNMILTLGYMPSTTGTDITHLASPDGDQFKTVYGRGYRMTFSTQSVDGLVANKSHFVRDIEEVNMQTKPLTSITGSEGQKWNCFALRIVRNVDRINSTSGRPYTTPGTYDAVTASNTLVHGVRVACPVQTVDSLNTVVSENGVNYQKNMLRLQMARRVLPADLWEINTDPSYLCAVPSDTAMSKGTCYYSTDTDSSKYVQYSVKQLMTDGSYKDCGPNTGGNECPSYVSICYRSY